MNQPARAADHISVCVCTYRRNEMLEHLLRNLAFQKTDGLFEHSCVVVDNDADGHARETVGRLQAELSLDITYSIEPERTIPAARNHALRLAHGNFVGIIDDDEFPPSNWLLQMYEGVRTFGVDGALGPVRPFFPPGAPSWLERSGLCALPTAGTGTLLHWSRTRTGNVLLKKDVFDQHGLRFDPAFRTGGSDQEFFRQAMARACRFVWVDEAPVYEVVPSARWTVGYWVRRALVNGFNARRYALAHMSKTRQAALTLKSALAAPVYALSLPVCAFAGMHRVVPCLEKGAYHLSRACASIGVELWKKRDF